MLKEKLGEEKYFELKNNSNLIYKALELITILFENDVDKGGHPYIIHLMQVYKSVSTYEEKIVALLHDIMEDKNVSVDELKDLGFNDKIIFDIKNLTREKQDEYSIYIDNLIKKGSIECLNVKLADLKNNMDLSRIKTPTEADFSRVHERYEPAYLKILNELERRKEND